MTGELQTQQGELIKANRLLDSGKEFIEAVLRGVSAGVLGLDPKGRINVANRVACELLGMSAEELRTKHLSEVMPDIEPLLDQARRRPRRLFEQGTVYQRGADRALRLLVRVAIEENREGVFGFVVTLDDITELEAAQRKAAWSDVARRIAHEIKNPLTPIQLSAERLRRKYLSQIDSEPETFKTCTDTIIRHVEDIGRMVDEFSAFARMPAPVFEEESLQELIEQTVFLQRTAETGFSYELDLPDDPIRVPCDRQQISRALTNLLLNAAEAIKARRAAEGPESEKGHIVVRLSREDRTPVIEVVDNGRGLPVRERDRLTEPYVTTRESGTGLGLAIVKKIVEDHDGDLHLLDNPEGGAIVRIRLMRDVAADSAQADAKVM
jgi:two-component system nitrogen regulation sensor histidine kinase NtrY